MMDGQWKERGIGDMKILVHPKVPPPMAYLEPRSVLPVDVELEEGINYARLLMRRDQVLKICTNHTISVDLPQFKPLSVANHGLCWVTKDYSDDVDGEVMTLGLRFKVNRIMFMSASCSSNTFAMQSSFSCIYLLYNKF